MEVTPWFRYSPKPDVSIFEYFRTIPVLKEDVSERTDTHYIDTRSVSRSYSFRMQWTNSELQIKLVQVVWVSLEQRITIITTKDTPNEPIPLGLDMSHIEKSS